MTARRDPLDDLLDAYAAAVLLRAAAQLRRDLFPRVYDDAGRHAAEGVNRAADYLTEQALARTPEPPAPQEHQQ